MKKTSKNKGFSLVELIVVILIMAIIAVALAPQVMKWVDRSRHASDATNYDTLANELKIAVVSPNAYSAAQTASYAAIIFNDKTMLVKTTDGTSYTAVTSDTDAVYKALSDVDSTWKDLKAKASDIDDSSEFDASDLVAADKKAYILKIGANGGVVRVKAPNTDSVVAD